MSRDRDWRAKERQFGTFLIAKGFVTVEALRELNQQQWSAWRPIGWIAIQRNLLEPAHVTRILELQAKHAMAFGETAAALGLLNRSQVEALLREQRSMVPTLEDLLVRCGVLSAMRLAEARSLFSENERAKARAASDELTGLVNVEDS